MCVCQNISNDKHKKSCQLTLNGPHPITLISHQEGFSDNGECQIHCLSTLSVQRYICVLQQIYFCLYKAGASQSPDQVRMKLSNLMELFLILVFKAALSLGNKKVIKITNGLNTQFHESHFYDQNRPNVCRL